MAAEPSLANGTVNDTTLKTGVRMGLGGTAGGFHES